MTTNYDYWGRYLRKKNVILINVDTGNNMETVSAVLTKAFMEGEIKREH